MLLLLGPNSGETDPAAVAARLCFEGRSEVLSSDVARALSLMPAYRTRELALLRALHRHGVDRYGTVLRPLWCFDLNGMHKLLLS